MWASLDICEGKKCSCNAFGELVEGTEQQKCLNVNLKKKKKKIRGTRHPSTLPTTHLSVMYVLYSGQIRDWRIQASFREGGVEGWDCLLMGSPSPSTFAVCFTPTSPATSAEGLCLYNSGYLHWVRKHTHEHSRTLIHLLHRLWKKLLIHFVHTPSLKLQEGFHQCNVFHIFVFWKQYYAVYYWKCWQDLFSAPLQGRTGISAVLTCSADSCSCSTVYSCWNVLGRFTVCWGETQTWDDSNLRNLNFHQEPVAK